MCYWPGAERARQEQAAYLVSVLTPLGARDPATFRQALARLGYVRDVEAAAEFVKETT